MAPAKIYLVITRASGLALFPTERLLSALQNILIQRGRARSRGVRSETALLQVSRLGVKHDVRVRARDLEPEPVPGVARTRIARARRM
jgi:hypothetical protein